MKPETQLGNGNEIKNKYLHDFTILNNLVYSSEKIIVKQHINKFKILSENEIETIFRKLNMIKVRDKRNTTSPTFKKRTHAEIRNAIVSELLKQPQCSIYQLSKSSRLNYASLRNWIKRNGGMLEVVKQDNATYVKLSDEYRRNYSHRL
jgi:hypothetical protein